MERNGYPPSNPEAKKMKSLTLHIHDSLLHCLLKGLLFFFGLQEVANRLSTAASIWFEILGVVDPGQQNFDFSTQIFENFDFPEKFLKNFDFSKQNFEKFDFFS